MNTPLLIGWGVTFAVTLIGVLKWTHRRERTRRVSRGLRAYASGAQIG